MCLRRTTGQKIKQLSPKRKMTVLSQQLSHLPAPSVSNIFSFRLRPGASELVPPPRKGWVLEKGAYRPALQEKLSLLLQGNSREAGSAPSSLRSGQDAGMARTRSRPLSGVQSSVGGRCPNGCIVIPLHKDSYPDRTEPRGAHRGLTH